MGLNTERKNSVWNLLAFTQSPRCFHTLSLKKWVRGRKLCWSEEETLELAAVVWEGWASTNGCSLQAVQCWQPCYQYGKATVNTKHDVFPPLFKLRIDWVWCPLPWGELVHSYRLSRVRIKIWCFHLEEHGKKRERERTPESSREGRTVCYNDSQTTWFFFLQGISQCLQTFLVVNLEEWEDAICIWKIKARMLLKPCDAQDHPSLPAIIWPRMATVLRLKNPDPDQSLLN